MSDNNDALREALERIKYKATSLADAQVIALEALAASKPEPQAQAGEPEPLDLDEVAGFCRVAFGKDAGAFNSGVDDVLAELKRRGPLITLQSHHEAIAKKDAALRYCVEALEVYAAAYSNFCRRGMEILEPISDDAINQAKEALK